jgi:UDP-N-acetylmuramoylalanine--D-glutamate ligase
MPGWRHQKVTIMGLGLWGGGAGAARFWARLGARVTITDLRSAEELAPSLEEIEDLGCRLVLGEHRDRDFTEADVVVVNPAVRPDNPFVQLARENKVNITTEIGTLFRMAHGPLFGITGTNGKSTTTALLGSLLKYANEHTLVGGNLGGSLLPLMETHLPSAPIVLELSSFQLHYLGEHRISPTVAIITNLAPNHLDWHGSLEAYYSAKRNILRYQWPEDLAIFNAEDKALRAWADGCLCRVGLFSREDPDYPNAAFVRDGEVIARLAGREEVLFPLDAVRLPGRHNLGNILAAALAAYAHAGWSERMRNAVAGFAGLPHRLETIAKRGGIDYVNDSVSTTPESTIMALETCGLPIVLIAGGQDKGVDFEQLASVVARRVHAAVLIGKTSRRIRDAISRAGAGEKVHLAESLEEAVMLARDFCPGNGTVLLSPGCSSQDMFPNFEARGESFRRIVETIAKT